MFNICSYNLGYTTWWFRKLLIWNHSEKHCSLAPFEGWSVEVVSTAIICWSCQSGENKVDTKMHCRLWVGISEHLLHASLSCWYGPVRRTPMQVQLVFDVYGTANIYFSTKLSPFQFQGHWKCRYHLWENSAEEEVFKANTTCDFKYSSEMLVSSKCFLVWFGNGYEIWQRRRVATPTNNQKE